jgi:hypothetical protein
MREIIRMASQMDMNVIKEGSSVVLVVNTVTVSHHIIND